MGMVSALNGHLDAEVGGDVVADGGSYAVAHLVEVLEVEGNWDVGHNGLLTIDVAFPVVVELVAEDGGQSCVAVGGACPIHVVEIASNGNGETWGQGGGILSRDILGEAYATVGMFAKLRENGGSKT